MNSGFFALQGRCFFKHTTLAQFPTCFGKNRARVFKPCFSGYVGSSASLTYTFWRKGPVNFRAVTTYHFTYNCVLVKRRVQSTTHRTICEKIILTLIEKDREDASEYGFVQGARGRNRFWVNRTSSVYLVSIQCRFNFIFIRIKFYN